ncbi:alpha/beta hydrolase fold domain-containing protein [Ilumatobacter sp.]|uniref:alpha/beta hydrolase fold domain-containing protein n=1 Tax=Ilumatobacter sp. TaxID=1967498 RepID=UPI003B5161F9
MKLSRRARLVRRTIPRLVRESDATLEERRAAMEKIDRLPRPRRVDYVDTVVGGVPAIVATPVDAHPARHVLYIHGGGYVLGSPRTHVAMCARLARRADAAITVIDYRLAPEHPYPAAIDDCVAAYRELASRVDPAVVAIAGDSAGGGAALATLCALRDAGDRLPACAYLQSPWTDLTASGETVRTMVDDDVMIDAATISETGRQYAGDRPLDHPGVSPLFADLSGLPPTLIQTGTHEVLLSDSTRLADRLTESGVYNELDLADGLWHVYPSFAGFVPESTAALIHAARFIRAHCRD